MYINIYSIHIIHVIRTHTSRWFLGQRLHTTLKIVHGALLYPKMYELTKLFDMKCQCVQLYVYIYIFKYIYIYIYTHDSHKLPFPPTLHDDLLNHWEIHKALVILGISASQFRRTSIRNVHICQLPNNKKERSDVKFSFFHPPPSKSKDPFLRLGR